ncbi:MAG: hypothetical protein V3T31_05350, partial [candidate division Zixibacteria bacterium]
ASWNGSMWKPLGLFPEGVSGGSAGVFALTSFDDKLIVGGFFSGAGGISANKIASWDGINWALLGPGMSNGRISALVAYDGNLIAGGSFTTAGGIPAKRLAFWNGGIWQALLPGTNKDLFSLEVLNGKLFIGGTFDMLNLAQIYKIAAWDGVDWSSLGSGMNNGEDAWASVNAIVAYDNSLFVGGSFIMAGEKPSPYIAQWTKECTDGGDYDSDNISDMCDNCQLTSNFDQIDTDGDGVGDACQFVETTPQGSGVVTNPGAGVEITFDNVTSSGNTEVTYSAEGPASGNDFQIIPANMPAYYGISTEAGFSGAVEICINYDDAGLSDADEAALTLQHYDDGLSDWTNITSNLDTVTNIICGSTTSLSPFAVAISSAPGCCVGLTGDLSGTNNDTPDISDLTALINHLFVTLDALDCKAEANTNGDPACSIDISDLTALINHLFVTFEQLSPCGQECY